MVRGEIIPQKERGLRKLEILFPDKHGVICVMIKHEKNYTYMLIFLFA